VWHFSHLLDHVNAEEVEAAFHDVGGQPAKLETRTARRLGGLDDGTVVVKRAELAG